MPQIYESSEQACARVDELSGMLRPYEWGDFLAGTMSPIAFMWLVFGYLQQGQELRLNTEALQAQLKELAFQVESTKVIAESSTQQAKITKEMHEFNLAETERLRNQQVSDRVRAIKPIIYVTISMRKNNRIDLSMRNVGGDAFRLALYSGHFVNCECHDVNRLARESVLGFSLNTSRENKHEPFLSISCLDCDDNVHEIQYHFDEINNRVTDHIPYMPNSEDE